MYVFQFSNDMLERQIEDRGAKVKRPIIGNTKQLITISLCIESYFIQSLSAWFSAFKSVGLIFSFSFVCHLR